MPGWSVTLAANHGADGIIVAMIPRDGQCWLLGQGLRPRTKEAGCTRLLENLASLPASLPAAKTATYMLSAVSAAARLFSNQLKSLPEFL
jgi:hypothetical protein